ncbi:MAG: hypothetical protein AAGH73_05880 [Pseudomonadota bacterium]
MRAVFLACLIFLASPASALSCLPVSVSRAYLDAAAAEETYVIALGRFSFAPEALAPRPAGEGSWAGTRRVAAGFTGALFSADGFDFLTELDVTIAATCAGPWCASMAPGVETLAFLQEQADGYLLSLGPCGGSAFPDPTKAQIARIRACHAGGPCAGESAGERAAE